MPHPLVEQLRFARSEFRRGIAGVSDEDACRRILRDPNDWPAQPLAIALDAGILTNDYDFFGCGCPTWTVDTLRAELANP